MRKEIILCFLLFSQAAKLLAQDTATHAAGQGDQGAASPTTRSHRSDSNLTLGVEPFVPGTWIQGKRGFFLTSILSPDTSLELEYLSGSVGLKLQSIEVAEFKETMLLAAARSYFGTNHFNFRYGGGIRTYEITLGDKYLTPGLSETLLGIQSYVLTFAVGNRWQWGKGFSFGVDWFEIVIPFYQRSLSGLGAANTGNSETDTAGDTLVRILRFAPTFSVLKAQIGWTF